MMKHLDRKLMWLGATALLGFSSPIAAVAYDDAITDGDPSPEMCATVGVFLPGYRPPAAFIAPKPPVAPPQVSISPPAPRISPIPTGPLSAIDQCYADAGQDEKKLAACDALANAVTAVVSTGTRIRGLPEDAALPVEVLTREQLQNRGAPNMSDLLRSVTEASKTAPDANTGASGYGDAQISLRGMGSGRTLGMVNGRRLDELGAAPPPPPPPAPARMSPPPAPRLAPNAPPVIYRDAPLGIGSERYPNAQLNGFKQVAEEPMSTFSIDVDTAAYANVRRFLSEGQRPPREAVRVEEMINYFDYGYSGPERRETPFSTHLAMTPAPWADGRQLIHIGVQGFKPAAGTEPPLNLVFLVDTSGSMSSPDRLPLAQKSLNVLIDQLRPQDKVSMVAYAGSAGAVLSPTDGRQKLKMRCAVNALQSGGSTAGGAGLKLAYGLAEQNFDKNAVNRVILMTDGDFNVGVTDNKSLEDFVADKRKSGIYLSVYGYGRGNYQDQRMQVLAQNGNGTAAYVDRFSEARKLFRTDFTRSLYPIADDVKIQVEFNPARVAEYRLVGYETRMLKKEDFNNDAIDAGEVGAGASVTAIYEITPVDGRRMVDRPRYGERSVAPTPSQELAFLKIRYKAPGGKTSQLITRPITARDSYASLDAAPASTRWAVAVAAYGQKLRDDPFITARFGWEDVLTLAQKGRGDDPDGLRAEMVALTQTARDLRDRNAGL